jgi:replicative DNA helicase
VSAADAVRDEATERAIIACLLNGARVDDVAAPPEAFSVPAYRAVYEACCEALRRFTAVDVAMVRSVLEVGKAPAEVTDLVDVLALADCRPENLAKYVDGLLEFHARRVAIRKMEAGILAMANPKTRVDVVAEETAAVLGALGSGRDEARGGEDVRAILSDYRDMMEAQEAQREPRPAYLPTPFVGHGEGSSIFRGYPAKKGVSCLGVIAGRSGNGKTARIATLMHHWICRMRKKVGLFGLEDGTRWLVERWVARDFGMNWGEVGTALPETKYIRHMDASWMPERFADDRPRQSATYFPPRISFFRALEAYESILDERLLRHAAGGIAAPKLLAKCRRWIDEGAEAILVDHGLRVNYVAGRNERLDYAIGQNINRLSELTVTTGVPIILAWHLNRANGDESPPVMGDLKESGYLDADAASIEGTWRVKGADGMPDRTFSNVMKSRRSGGIGKVIELAWAGESGMMAPEACREVDFAREYAERKAAAKAAGKRGALGV